MSMGLIGAVVSVLCGGLLWAWTRRTNNEPAPSVVTAPVRWTVALRVEGEDGPFARLILDQATSDEDPLIDFMRLVPSATHFYAGEWTSQVRCDLSGGTIVRIDASHPAGAIKDLGEVLAFLRALKAGANVKLSIATSNPEGAPLHAAQETKRPGHRQCRYCRHSFVIHDLECPSCGGAVEDAS